MAHSSFDQLCPARPLSIAQGHYADGEVVHGGWRVQPSVAAAGLWTTAGDLARLAVEVQRASAGCGRRLSSSSIEQALKPGPDAGWGLGTLLGGEAAQRRFGHDGNTIGFLARTRAYLECGQGAVVLVNGDAGRRVIDMVFEGIAGEYAWP
jgi:hypothetical protein